MTAPVAGVVLAGGEGRRFGGPKAFTEVDGVRMVDRAVAILRDAGCDPIIVMAGELDLTIDAAIVLPDPGNGPLAALDVAANHLGGGDFIVLACDLPNAAPLIERLLMSDAPAVAVDPDGRVQPLCARWPVAGVQRVAVDHDRAMALVDALAPTPVTASARELENRNHPEG